MQYEPTPSVWYVREYRAQLARLGGTLAVSHLATLYAHNAYCAEFYPRVTTPRPWIARKQERCINLRSGETCEHCADVCAHTDLELVS